MCFDILGLGQLTPLNMSGGRKIITCLCGSSRVYFVLGLEYVFSQVSGCHFETHVHTKSTLHFSKNIFRKLFPQGTGRGYFKVENSQHDLLGYA